MIKTRTLNGVLAFYETSTGINLGTIKSVSIKGVDDTVITVVYKDSVPYIHLPQRDNTPLVKLSDAVSKMDMIITKVA